MPDPRLPDRIGESLGSPRLPTQDAASRLSLDLEVESDFHEAEHQLAMDHSGWIRSVVF